MNDPELNDVLARSRDLGFLGPGGVESHLDNARAFVDLIEGGRRVLDLGSGGGIPGLVLARRCPDVDVSLLDANERRVAFLRRVVAELGLEVQVLEGRAEDLGRRPELRGRFDTVVARSFASPPVTAECGGAFLGSGGRLVVSEPPAADDRWPTAGCAVLGLSPTEVHVTSGARLQVLVLDGVYPDEFPRANGVPSRRPLW